MDWAQILTVFAIVATNLITVVTLHIHLDNNTSRKIDEHRKETNDILRGIQQEMKDFHGRLCAIEERNKK